MENIRVKENDGKKKPECYHATCMWSADSCCKCEYDMDCYHKWLEHMRRNKDD